jgi:hypothetical protein
MVLIRFWCDLEAILRRFGCDSDTILILFQDIFKKSKQSNKNTENTLLTHIKIISKSKLQSQAANKSEQPIRYESYQSMNSMKVTILDTLHPRACWCHNPCRVAVLRWVFQSERTGQTVPHAGVTCAWKFDLEQFADGRRRERSDLGLETWEPIPMHRIFEEKLCCGSHVEFLRVWWDLAQLHRTAWSIWSISLVESLQSIHSCTHVVFEHFASHLLKSNKQRKHIAESFMPFFKRAWPRGHFCRAWMIRPLWRAPCCIFSTK